MTHPAIRTEDLRRTYKKPRKRWGKKPPPDTPTEFVALDGVSLEVQPGELFGLLGPNGAGKTTLIKILTTLLAPTSGKAWVDGHDVVNEATAVRPKINMVSGGESSGYGILNVRENLWLFSRIYGVPNKTVNDRITTMLDVVEMSDKATSRVSHLSTGQRQKMNFCRGFITDPKILFLDEPTLGLDVTSARRIRAYLREWMKEQPERTLLLTTHYMAEADELCDRLAVIDGGKVLACDTPANLKRRVQKHSLFELSVQPRTNPLPDVAKLPGVENVTRTDTPTTADLRVSLTDESAVGGVVQAVVSGGARILTLNKVEPTLEDVFIQLVGRRIDAANEPRHQFRQVRRQRHRPVQLRPAHRVRESELGGVQRQPRRAAGVRNLLAVRLAVIHLVPAHRVPRFAQVNPDLVRAARFQTATEERKAVEPLLDADVRDRRFAHLLQRGAPPPAVPAVADEVRADRLCREPPGHQREIPPHHRVLAEL